MISDNNDEYNHTNALHGLAKEHFRKMGAQKEHDNSHTQTHGHSKTTTMVKVDHQRDFTLDVKNSEIVGKDSSWLMDEGKEISPSEVNLSPD